MNNKGFANIILIIIALVIIAGGASYLVFNKSTPEPTPVTPEKNTTPTPQQNPIVPPPAQTQNGKPSITAQFPKGGETLEDGKEYTIAWKSENAPAGSGVYLFLEKTTISGGKAYTSGSALGNSLSPTGSYKWVARIPGDYKIILELRKAGWLTAVPGGEGILASDTSNALFKIIYPSGAARSIKILSPNGGEQFETGKTYQIKWTSSNISPTAKIRVSYTRADINTEGSSEIVTTTNTGTVSWATPAYISSFFAEPMCQSEGVVVSVPIKIGITWINEQGGYQEADNSDSSLTLRGPCKIFGQ